MYIRSWPGTGLIRGVFEMQVREAVTDGDLPVISGWSKCTFTAEFRRENSKIFPYIDKELYSSKRHRRAQDYQSKLAVLELSLLAPSRTSFTSFSVLFREF